MRPRGLVAVIIVSIVVTTVVVAPIAIVITVAIVIPIVMVLKSATVAFPIAFVKLAAIVARANPASSLVGWSRPVTGMPTIAPACRIPISVHPKEVRAWPWGALANDPGRRRRTDSNSERNLGVARRHESKQQHSKHGSSNKPFHCLSPSVERHFLGKV